MLIIRTAQFEALSDYFVLPEYEDTMLAYVRHAYPDVAAASGKPALLDKIRRLRRQALGYGASDAAAWGQYAVLAMACAPEFQNEPAIAAILADPALAWHRKFDTLLRLLRQSEKGWIDDSATGPRERVEADRLRA